MKNKIILITAWVINILALLMSIILPKNNKAYTITFYLFLICIFIIPLLLSGYETKVSKTNCCFNEIKINACGSIVLMLLSMVRFIQTIEKIAWPMFFTIVVLFIALTIIVIIVSKQVTTFKQHLWLALGNLSLVYIYYLLLMIISYDYSVVW